MTAGATLAQVPPRATGSLEVYEWRDGRTVTFRARLRAYGERYRIDFGTNLQGWNEARAIAELERISGQIARGTWEPPAPEPSQDDVDEAESVHVTLSRWWEKRRDELGATTQDDYRWRIDHILRHLSAAPTGELDARAVDEFRLKLRRAGLAPRSVNMILDVLAQALDDAVDYGLLPANPARGPRRREKVPKSSRSFLEPDMVVDLLDEAGAWERELPAHQRYGRRALLATLCLAGPRISEITEARRAGLDVHAGVFRLGKKTAAGIDRHLELTAFLTAELRSHLAGVPADLRDQHGADLPVFPTRTGGELNPSNIRNRLLTGTPARKGSKPTKGVVERVNEKRAREGKMLLPPRVTPHTLRRTFASLCFFAGRDLRWVMGQLGHDDPRMTLAVYAQVLKRSRIDHELVWSLMRFADEQENPKTSGPRIGPTPHAAAPASPGGRVR